MIFIELHMRSSSKHVHILHGSKLIVVQSMLKLHFWYYFAAVYVE